MSSGRRLRAIALPCPSFIPISTKVASMTACAAMVACYLSWSIALWSGYFELTKIKSESSGQEFDELVLMARYSQFSAWFTVTETCLCLGAFAVSIWPQTETAKWLSRLIWFGWIGSWGFGIFGIVAYLSSDAFLAAGCERGNECWTIRQRLQVGLTIAVFATLAIVFYCAVILSSFVHTLHPHLFISPDSDSDDDYSDFEEHRAEELEEELLRSGHPYAGDALLLLAHERQQLAAKRSTSRLRAGYVPEKDDNSILPQAPGVGGRRTRTDAMVPKQQRAHSSDEYSGSSPSSSESDDEERAVLVNRASGRSPAMSGPGTGRGRPPARGSASQLSDFSISDLDSSSDRGHPESPATQPLARVEQREMDKRLTHPRSRSRSRSRASRG